MKKNKFSFHYVFQLSKLIVFEVDYYLLGSNKEKDFSTSAAEFNRPKSDFNHCGQAQKELLKGFTAAMNFYNKWDFMHNKDITEMQHAEMLKDIELLKSKYNFIERFSDRDISFSELKELSKMPLKKLPKPYTL